MVVSIGAVASASQGVFYYEKDGYYAKDDPEHRDASAWTGRGAEELDLSGPVDPDVFQAILEGEIPDGSGRRLGRRDKEGDFQHRARPGPHLLRTQVRLPRCPGRRRRPHRRGPRPGRQAHPGLGREECGRDPHEESGDGPHDPRRKPEDGRRHLPARHLPQSRSPAPHPFGPRQHGPGRRRQVADHGQREALRLEDAYRGPVPERAGARSGKTRLRIEKTHADGRFEIAGSRGRSSRRSRRDGRRSRRPWPSGACRRRISAWPSKRRS